MTDIDINNGKNESDEVKNKIVTEFIKHCDDKHLREIIIDMATHVNMLGKQLENSRNYESSN